MASRRPSLLSATAAGFTLIEVVIAVAIFALAFAAITQITARSSEKSYMAGQLSIVAMLARNKMIETEYEIEGKPFEEVDKTKEGAFEGSFKNFRWKRTIKEIEFPTFGGGASGSGGDKDSGGDQAGKDAAANIAKMVSQYLSKAVREVTVDIIWKRGKNDQTYSVTTYWVDLNHEFQAGLSQ